MLRAADIIASAEARAGISDPEPYLHGALHALVAALNGDNRLSSAGETVAHRRIVSRTVDRLNGLKKIRQNPEIENEKIDAPVFLTGVPGSGCDQLRHLFDDDRRFRPVGAPRAGGDGDGDAVLEQGYGAADLFTHYDAPSHFDYLIRRMDMRAVYGVYRRQLQLLQWRAPVKPRWALHSSSHIMGMEAILATFPDARFVLMHRDPVQSLARIARQTVRARAARYDAPVDAHRVGRQMMDFMRRHTDRLLEFCAGPDGGRVIHIDHDALIADPLSQWRRVHDALGIATPDDARATLSGLRWGENDDAMDADALERFGIEAEQADAMFADYRHRFGIHRESHALASIDA